MLENFVILHSNGECLFLKHYGGDPLSLNLVLGISSSLSTLAAVTKKKPHKSLTGAGSGAAAGDTKSAAGSVAAIADADGSGGGGNSLCSISANGLQFVYADSAPLTLVAVGADWSGGSSGTAYLGSCVRAVEELLLYYVGPFLAEPNHIAAIKGVLDVVDKLLLRMASDVSVLARGVRWVFLDEEKREQSDRVLAAVEQHQHIFGSCLVLGSSVLHARLSPTDTRMVLWQLTCRPLGLAKVRCVPVFSSSPGGTALAGAGAAASSGAVASGSGGASAASSAAASAAIASAASSGVWKQLVLVRLRHGMVLALLCTLRTAYSQLSGVIDALDDALTDTGAGTIGTTSLSAGGASSGLSNGGAAGSSAGGSGGSGGGGSSSGVALPVEEPPVLLRHYTGHDTVMFVYVHLATHVCVAPPPRPGPSTEQALTVQAFASFYAKVCALSAAAQGAGQTTSVALHERGYRFSAQFTDEYNLFALYSDRVSVAAIDDLNREILKNVARHLRPLSELAVTLTAPAAQPLGAPSAASAAATSTTLVTGGGVAPTHQQPLSAAAAVAPTPKVGGKS